MTADADALFVGECMLELRHVDDDILRLGHGGDTYNAAVYFRRTAGELGLDVGAAYLTGVGDDPDSDAMRAAWAREGIADRAVVVPGRGPGLYTVRTDDDGERAFAYWRGESAARALLSRDDWVPGVAGSIVHLSGITLQLTSGTARAALADRLDELRRGGTQVSLDVNYRPQAWPSVGEARGVVDAFARRADVVFSSLEDERALHGDVTPADSLARIRALGPREAIVKAGAGGVWLADGRGSEHLPAVSPARVVDTTAAGDALAGAYLAARLAGRGPREALGLAMRVAAVVISHPGAVAPQAR